MFEPYKGATKGACGGFGNSLGREIRDLLMPRRGLLIDGTAYGIRGIHNAIKRRTGDGTLSFIRAAHFRRALSR